MSAATSIRSSATWSRSASAWCASGSGKEVSAKAELAAEERVLDALVGASASPTTRESFRKRLRDGELDDKEIEIEVRDTGAGMPSFEIPGMPGASRRRHEHRRDARQGVRRPHQDAPGQRQGFARHPGQRGIRQAARQRGGDPGGDRRRSRTTASSSSTRSTRSAPARAAAAPTSAARACSATSCR